jgi:hypothetical protein
MRIYIQTYLSLLRNIHIYFIHPENDTLMYFLLFWWELEQERLRQFPIGYDFNMLVLNKLKLY